jgi:hypothetical protein
MLRKELNDFKEMMGQSSGPGVSLVGGLTGTVKSGFSSNGAKYATWEELQLTNKNCDHLELKITE